MRPSFFGFDFSVTPGETYYIDPLVAIGYQYAIGAGDPNIASILLPNVGDDSFAIYGPDGTTFLGNATAGTPFNFLNFYSGGVNSFKVLGIETSAGLNPDDPLAFISGLTFTGTGRFTGTMTPITEYVPEPATMLLLGLGLVGIAGARRKFEK